VYKVSSFGRGALGSQRESIEGFPSVLDLSGSVELDNDQFIQFTSAKLTR
jgi:hypothetical protein